VSASNVQALPTADWHMGLAYGLPPTFLEGSPNIDDPVNDTGLGPRRGDLQLADEFACLLSVI